ncbi:MAG: 4a-hydroxytetrahydrobiopterin dehydratase [Gemmataceae bacterium]|nr:4a-hydroxytetrahydrobiopterin dehydratase [Gemmataceae bacterium]
MSDALVAKKCLPCEGGVPVLTPAEIDRLRPQVPHWSLTADGKRLRREWKMKGFVAALEFFNKIGDLAEAEEHHPDLHLTGYRNVAVEIWTHAVGGLSENDFILAAKIDQLPASAK